MTDSKPAPRNRIRTNSPAQPPVTAPEPRVRQRTRAVEAPEPMVAPKRTLVRLSDLSRPWQELVGTDMDPFECGNASPYHGTAVGVAGGGPIMGFMMRADDGRYAIYSRMRNGSVKFAAWVSGSWHDAFHAVGDAWRKSREGLQAPTR